jgi:DNA invertase Pin-like site-specific DNA recombinase
MGTKSSTPRAIGIERISQRGGRDDDELHSLDNQRRRMELLSQAQAWHLLRVAREDTVSSGAALVDRPHLLAAVEAIEAGEAEILITAFKDRLEKEPAVRDEVIDRVEAVGGMVWSADHGRDTNETATAQFSGTVLSAAGRMMRRQAKERSREAVVEAIGRGTWPSPNVPLGYRLGEDRVLVPGPKAERVAIVKAFELRDRGATIRQVRLFLTERGIKRSDYCVRSILASRVYLGEIHFGTLVNRNAHKGIVDPVLFERVQGRCVPSGRRGKSDMLLARLSVLRCGACGGRMVSGSGNSRASLQYRCPSNNDCTHRTSIAAEIVEDVVRGVLFTEAASAEGGASHEQRARDVAAEAAEADRVLQKTTEQLTALGLLGEPGAMAGLAKLREERDGLAEEAALAPPPGERERVLRLVRDWDRLSLAAKREIITVALAEITVDPRGRGRGRIHVRSVTGEVLV